MRKTLQWSTQVSRIIMSQQDELILSNISLIKSKRWKNISQILKEKGFNKKQAQCRERYINFLSLSVDKESKISICDLQLFYQKYEQLGPRWTQIQQFLPKKSQVQLKNIFYGNIRCLIKKVFKFFTSKTAVFVNKFDTFTLQNIYSAKKNYKGLNFIKDDIKNMGFRFDENICLSLIQSKKEKYKKLFSTLLDEQFTKKSKHFDWFRKIQEKYIQSQSNLIKISEESPTELKFTNSSVNKKNLNSQINQNLNPIHQSSKKYEINHSQEVRENQLVNYNPILNLNRIDYQQIHRINYSLNTGQQIYFQPDQNSLGILNPFQNYENCYFFCRSWN